MKKRNKINRLTVIVLFFISLYSICAISYKAYATETTIEGVTKKAAFACKSKELISEAHSALRNLDTMKFNDYITSRDCWACEPNIKVTVIGNADWGKPVEVEMGGNRVWMMQHMIQYSPEKEKENELAKLFYAAGVGLQCQWAPVKVMMFKILRIGDYGIQEMGINADRVYELQKMHLSGGKEFAQRNGCNHPIVRMIKRDYEQYFVQQ